MAVYRVSLDEQKKKQQQAQDQPAVQDVQPLQITQDTSAQTGAGFLITDLSDIGKPESVTAPAPSAQTTQGAQAVSPYQQYMRGGSTAPAETKDNDPLKTPKTYYQYITRGLQEIENGNVETGNNILATAQAGATMSGCSWYMPYAAATDTSVGELRRMGYLGKDEEITEDWINKNAYLLDKARRGSTGNILGPTQKSTKEQNAAYYYYQLVKDNGSWQNTQAYNNEMAALQSEIDYWVGRTDRNYSDDEIIDHIDMSKYPTLKKMQASLSPDNVSGKYVALTGKADYSPEAMYGMIWNARNKNLLQGQQPDIVDSMVNYYRGTGNTWVENKDITERLDPTSARYNPYAIGSTLDDAGLYFGAGSFGKDWVNENRAYLGSGDMDAKMYNKVRTAEEFTANCESELESLNDTVNRMIENGSSESAILNMLDGATGKNLQKLDDSLKSGNILATTRAINYSRGDIEQYIHDKCANREAASKNTEQAAQFLNLNFNPKDNVADSTLEETNREIAAYRQALQDAAPAVMEFLSQDEKSVYITTGISQYDKNVMDAAKGMVASGLVSSEASGMVSSKASEFLGSLDFANNIAPVLRYNAITSEIESLQNRLETQYGHKYAASEVANPENAEFFALSEDEQLQVMVDNAMKDVPGMFRDDPEAREQVEAQAREVLAAVKAGDANIPEGALQIMKERVTIREEDSLEEQEAKKRQREINDIYYRLSVLEQDKAALQGKYDQGKEAYDTLENMFSLAYEAAYISGGFEAAQAAIEPYVNYKTIYELGSTYEPTQWNATDDYTDFYNGMMAQGVVEEGVDKAAYYKGKALEMADKDISDLTVAKRDLEDQIAFAKENGLYDAYGENLERKLAAFERNLQAARYYGLQGESDFAEKTSAANPILGELDNIFTPDMLEAMSKEEKDTYLYLYSTAGQKEARKYLDFLTDDTYGILPVRVAKQDSQAAKDAVNQSGWAAAGMTGLTFLANIVSGAGSVYSLIQRISGNEINPYHQAFSASRFVSDVRGQVTENLEQYNGDMGTFLSMLYQAGTSSVDSMISAVAVSKIGLGAGLNLAGETAATGAQSFFYKALGSLVSASPMGLQAMSSSIYDAKMRGSTDDQALLLGASTFFSETITEAVEFNGIMEAFHHARGISEECGMLKDIFKNAFNEAIGEGINEVMETAFDKAIMGRLSNVESTIQNYMVEYGVGRAQAERMAMRDVWNNGLKAAAIGAMSGGGSSLVSATVGSFGKARTIQNTDRQAAELNNEIHVSELRLQNMMERYQRILQQSRIDGTATENTTSDALVGDMQGQVQTAQANEQGRKTKAQKAEEAILREIEQLQEMYGRQVDIAVQASGINTATSDARIAASRYNDAYQRLQKAQAEYDRVRASAQASTGNVLARVTSALSQAQIEADNAANDLNTIMQGDNHFGDEFVEAISGWTNLDLGAAVRQGMEARAAQAAEDAMTPVADNGVYTPAELPKAVQAAANGRDVYMMPDGTVILGRQNASDYAMQYAALEINAIRSRATLTGDQRLSPSEIKHRVNQTNKRWSLENTKAAWERYAEQYEAEHAQETTEAPEAAEAPAPRPAAPVERVNEAETGDPVYHVRGFEELRRRAQEQAQNGTETNEEAPETTVPAARPQEPMTRVNEVGDARPETAPEAPKTKPAPYGIRFADSANDTKDVPKGYNLPRAVVDASPAIEGDMNALNDFITDQVQAAFDLYNMMRGKLQAALSRGDAKGAMEAMDGMRGAYQQYVVRDQNNKAAQDVFADLRDAMHDLNENALKTGLEALQTMRDTMTDGMIASGLVSEDMRGKPFAEVVSSATQHVVDAMDTATEEAPEEAVPYESRTADSADDTREVPEAPAAATAPNAEEPAPENPVPYSTRTADSADDVREAPAAPAAETAQNAEEPAPEAPASEAPNTDEPAAENPAEAADVTDAAEDLQLAEPGSDDWFQRFRAMIAEFLPSDQTGQTVAVTAAITDLGQGMDQYEQAQAAGVQLINELGGKNAMATVYNALTVSENVRDTQAAFTVAALSGTDAPSHQALLALGTKPSAQAVQDFVAAAKMDAANPEIQSRIQNAQAAFLANRALVDAIGHGGLSSAQAHQQVVEGAQQEVGRTEGMLQDAQTNEQAASDNLKSVQAQWSTDPGSRQKQAALNTAIEKLQGARVSVQQQQQAVAKARAKLAAAQAAARQATGQAVNNIRTQAQAAAAQQIADRAQQRTERAQAEQQRAQAEQQAKEENRQTRNAGRMNTEQGSISADRAAPAGSTPRGTQTGPIKSGQEIMQTLGERLGLPMDTRRKKYMRQLRNSTRGYTRRNTGIQHIQDAQNIRTAMHELGHTLDDFFDITGNAAATGLTVNDMIAKLGAIDPMFGSWIAQYKPNQVPSELTAEFVKHWAMNRQDAVDITSEDFVNWFEDQLRGKGWLDAMQQAAQDMQALIGATAAEEITARIHLDETKPLTRWSQMSREEKIAEAKKTLMRFETGMFDYTQPLWAITKNALDGGTFDASKDPRTLMLAMNNMIHNLTAQSIMGNGLCDLEGNLILKEDGTAYGPLNEILNKVDQKDEQIFNNFWIALHTKDRERVTHKSDNRVHEVLGIDHATLDDYIREVETAHPEFRDIIDEAEQWFGKLMESYLVDTGLLPAEQFEKMRGMYPHYIPTFRLGAQQQTNVSTSGRSTTQNGLRRTKGGTQDIYNPVMGLVEYVQKYIATAKQAEVYRAFDHAMENWNGINAIAERAQRDMAPVDTRGAKEAAQNKVIDMIKEGLIEITDDNLDAVVEGLSSLPDKMFVPALPGGNDVLNVPMPDGTVHSWTIYDKDIMAALLPTPPAKRAGILRAIGAMTGFLCSQATSRNIGFGLQNYASDTTTAFVTSHSNDRSIFGYAYRALGTLKYQVEQMIAEKQGKPVDEMWRQFQVYGETGSRFAFRVRDTQTETREALYGGQRKTTPMDVIKKVVQAPVAAIEGFTGFFETATRLTEFRAMNDVNGTYAQHLEAGKAAREITVDFSKHGKWEGLKYAKAVIPFMGAQLQGIYKTAKMFSDQQTTPQEKRRVAARLITHSLLFNLIMGAIRGLTWEPEEQEAYLNMSAYERNKYYHIKLGDGQFFRVKKSQDAILQMVDNLGEWLGMTLTGFEDNDFGQLMSLAKEVASNVTIGYDTVLDPWIDAANNKNWYGGAIESSSDLALSVSNRYDENTGTLDRMASGMFQMLGVDYSPLDVAYIRQQYTGSMGTFASNIMSVISHGNAGRLEAWTDAVSQNMSKRFLIDPVKSNTITSTFYDGMDSLSMAVADYKEGLPVGRFRTGLTPEEIDSAISDANTMIKSGGELAEIKKEMSGLWKEINTISHDTSLTTAEINAQTRDLRRQINELGMRGNAIIADYWAKYGYDNELVNNAVNTLNIVLPMKETGTRTEPITQVKLAPIFQGDQNKDYMQWANEVFAQTNKATSLPHPSMEWDVTDSVTGAETTYEVKPEEANGFNEIYRDTYELTLQKKVAEAGGWDMMTQTQREKALTSAHTAANGAAKKWWYRMNGIVR